LNRLKLRAAALKVDVQTLIHLDAQRELLSEVDDEILLAAPDVVCHNLPRHSTRSTAAATALSSGSQGAAQSFVSQRAQEILR
jgi:hypothetical protein